MDYKNGKIYVLRSHQTEDIYIGSTTTKLSKRFHNHKFHFKKWKNGKFTYITSFELMKYDDVYVELLELCPCDTKIELCRREGQLQREMECLNKQIAGRTPKEYSDDNKEKIRIQKQEWFESNKDKMKMINECECGGKYTQPHKSRHLKSKKHLNYKPLV